MGQTCCPATQDSSEVTLVTALPSKTPSAPDAPAQKTERPADAAPGSRGGETITIELDGSRDVNMILGIQVDLGDQTTLNIERILEEDRSLIHAWNLANPDRAVKVGDRITRANHVSGSAADIVRQCKMVEGERRITLEVERG